MTDGTGDASRALRERDVLRMAVPFLAAGVVVFAAVTDPAEPLPVALLAAAAGLFALWAWWPSMPIYALAAGVLILVLAAKRSGALDAGLFLVTLLAIVVPGWERSRPGVWVTVLVAAAVPGLIGILQPGDIDVSVWTVGIAFPGLVSWLFHRQEDLTAQLEETRRQLTARMVSDERRRIARDMHDLVGHGLAAVLLQVTSARHVLRRDLDEAEAALRTAEDVGRRSLAGLRGTVAMLRADGETPPDALPGLGDLPQLVDDVRAAGLSVERTTFGDHEHVGQVVGLALYRIAQEALFNAARHAPGANTAVTTRVFGDRVDLDVRSVGPLGHPYAQSQGGRPGYGLVGMRERAAAVGGTFEAGPVSNGWEVHCSVPISGRRTDPAEASKP